MELLLSFKCYYTSYSKTNTKFSYGSAFTKADQCSEAKHKRALLGVLKSLDCWQKSLNKRSLAISGILLKIALVNDSPVSKWNPSETAKKEKMLAERDAQKYLELKVKQHVFFPQVLLCTKLKSVQSMYKCCSHNSLYSTYLLFIRKNILQARIHREQGALCLLS